MGELKRILNKRFLLIILVLLILNALLLISFNEKGKEEMAVYDILKEYTLKNKDESNTYTDAYRLAWGQYIKDYGINKDTVTDDIKSARTLITAKAEYIDNYHTNVKEKMNFARAVLSTDFYEAQSFERINLYKTYYDLDEIKDAKVSLSNGRWLEELYAYDYNHIFILLILVFCVYGFFAERKNGLYYIIHTGKSGRGKLFIKRTLILLGLAFVISALFYLESTFILLKIYGGFEDINLPAACDEMFLLTSGNLSRIGFMFLQMLVSAIMAFALVMLLWFVLSLFSNVNIGMFAFILICAINVIIHMAVSKKTVFRALKYINMYYLMYPNKAIEYYNWGYDFGIMELFESSIIMSVVLGVLSFLINFYINARRYFTGKSNIFERIVNRIMDMISQAIEVMPTTIKEIYKILISQRAVVILAILIYIVSKVNVGGGNIYLADTIYVSEYYDAAKGLSYSNELEEVYKHFENEYEELLASIDVNDKNNKYIIENRLSVLNTIRANVDYLKKLDTQGIDAVALKPYEYDNVFGPVQNDSQKLMALINVVATIMISAGFISYEKKCNVNILANTYKNRQKWLLRKIRTNALLIAIFELISYGIYYHKISKVYELDMLGAPLKSLPLFEKCIINPPIIGFIIIDLIVKFILLVALSACICFISKYVKLIYCVIVSMFITIPQMLYMIGFEVMEKWSIGRYVAYLPVFNDSTQSITVYYAFVLVLLVIGSIIYMQFVKKGRTL
ncbi:MAG: hypothetical protein E7252_07465 [Lachnospira sp.]|nr:hypothetical protein [Lachnospira sp.]